MTITSSQAVIEALSRFSATNQRETVIAPETLLAELELDSLALLEVVTELEEALGVTLEAEALTTLSTVSDLIIQVNRARKSAA